MEYIANPKYEQSQWSPRRVSFKTAAKDLDICQNTQRSWLNASGYKPAEVAKNHRADNRQKELEAEIKKLRKEIAQKDEVIEILKNP